MSAGTNVADGRLGLMLSQLRLPTIKRIAGDLCAQSDREGWPGHRLLEALGFLARAEGGAQGLVTLVTDAHEPAFVELLDARLQMLRTQLGHVGLDVVELVEAEVLRQVVTVPDGDAEAASIGEVSHGNLQLKRETRGAKEV